MSQRERIEGKLLKREEEESINKSKWNETYSKLSKEIMSLRDEIGVLRSARESSSPPSAAKRRSAISQLASHGHIGALASGEGVFTLKMVTWLRCLGLIQGEPMKSAICECRITTLWREKSGERR